MIYPMQDATIIDAIRDKFVALLDDLDERGRRRWAAVEAKALGWGGITAVAQATGLSDRTIRTGLAELDAPNRCPATDNGVPVPVANRTASRKPACSRRWTG